ncbi:MAG: polysulfide reductase NrfD [Chloroflexi bacterium]|nr:polysulfide reductase NrfD [Chloroflexota bacterium]
MEQLTGIDEERYLEPVKKVGRGFYITVAFLLSIIAWGAFAWYTQFQTGLGITGLNRPVFWGFYITNFVFFIGISHAGTLVSAILRLTQAGWRRPITRVAEAITVFTLPVGAMNVLFDVGRPDRILNIILHPQGRSPLIWDIGSISMYLTASVIYLYLPLIPDIALCRDRIGGWRQELYRILALGWRGTEAQKKRLKMGIGIMAVVVIPIAVSVHTVVSWIFGMTTRAGWHSTIFGPYFVVGAIFSGIAAAILAMAVVRKVFHMEHTLKPRHFDYMGLLLLVLTAAYIYFTFAEYLTVYYGYGGSATEGSLLTALFTGEFALTFWVMVVFGFFVPGIILAFPQGRSIRGTVIASVLIVFFMWVKRFIIVVPSLSRQFLPYPTGFYQATWVEWSLTAASFAVFVLLYVVFSRMFPIVSVWELKEGEEEAREKAEEAAKMLAPAGAPRQSRASEVLG